MNRSKWIQRFLVIVTFGLLACSAFGQITWQDYEISINTTLDDKAATAVFEFMNSGTEPVKITSVKTSCGCTTAALAKDTYQPGESGKITATLAIGSRIGQQTKRIIVKTDSEQSPVTTLTMKVAIPEVLRIHPRLVYWRPGEDRKSKTVRITVIYDEPVELLGICLEIPHPAPEVRHTAHGEKSSVTTTTATESKGTSEVRADSLPESQKPQPIVECDAFKAELRQDRKDNTYLLVLTPREGAVTGDVNVRLVTTLPQENNKDFRGFHVMARLLPAHPESTAVVPDSPKESAARADHESPKADAKQ